MEKAANGHSRHVLMGFSLFMDPASEPQGGTHKNVATVVVYISMSFYPPSHAFFWDTIEEIYNKDVSLSIHLKKNNLFTSVCGLHCHIEWGILYR
jgi:hypothetical protein